MAGSYKEKRICDICGKQGTKYARSSSGTVRCQSCRNIGKRVFEYDIDLDMFRVVVHKVGDVIEYGEWFKEDEPKDFEL